MKPERGNPVIDPPPQCLPSPSVSAALLPSPSELSSTLPFLFCGALYLNTIQPSPYCVNPRPSTIFVCLRPDCTAMAQAPPAFTPDGDFAELETPQGTNNGGLSVTALARFEFEAGKANDGTKILMIEWEDDDLTRSSSEGFWNVSWTGKTTVLPADERPSDSLHRFYLLLPPNATIPPVVTLSYELQGTPDEIAAFAEKRLPQSRDSFKLNPLPAIFPPGLGATGRAAGKKGVLHTIWAKKRLRVLEQEIATESQKNIEGIALQMAIQEKEWIEENFGVGSRAVDSVSGHDSLNSSSMYPVTPVSPVNSKKLGDKLKGLKLQTSEKDLAVNNGMHPWFQA